MQTTNPQRIRIDNRRKEQNKWRSHVRWKRLVEEHAHVPGEICVHCLRKHGDPILDREGVHITDKRGRPRFVYLTINHKNRALYWNEDLYCTWNEIDMEICCGDCNHNIELGLKPCPVCHRSYIRWDGRICQGCWDKEHPDDAAARKAEQVAKKIRNRKLKRKLDKEAREKWIEEHPLKGKLPDKNDKGSY